MTISDTPKLPELLAPAGELSAAISAIENGADAVYAGLGTYNAREMAKNFTLEELSKLSGYLKRKQKRLYLTFNTLIKDSELPDAARQLEQAAALEPDGIIVQDLGVLSLVRRYLPELALHASTQMGIHNSDGVRIAAQLGISRVILERQVTIEELRSIVNESPIEIEAFVHGALCCSLSGRCLFSSWIGGWSGNRGKCKQPCRRRYHSIGKGGEKDSGFFFSTRDLALLDLLPDLSEIGVASVKIEGRLKKESYISSVVQAYRMVLDAIGERKGYPAGEISRAKQVLAGSYGRKWTHGFATHEEMREVVQPDSLGTSGLLIGETVESREGELCILLKRPLFIGDRIRVQNNSGQESPSITVTRIEQNGRSVKKAKSGRVRLTGSYAQGQRGLVYKISKSVRSTGPAPENLVPFLPRRTVEIEIEVKRNSVTGRYFDGNQWSRRWKRELLTEEARKQALSPKDIEAEFSVTRRRDLRVRRILASCEEGLFVPAKELKQARREFWDWLTEDGETTANDAASRGRLDEVIDEKLRKMAAAMKPPASATVSCLSSRLEGKEPSGADCTHLVLPLQSIDLHNKKSAIKREKEREIVLTHFTPQGDLPAVETQLRKLVELGYRKFRLTDLGHLALIRRLIKSGVQLSTGYPFPVTNSLSAELLAQEGIGRIQAWIELEKSAVEDIVRRNPVRTEQYRRGRPFLLATRAGIAVSGEIRDSRGKSFLVEKSDDEHLTYLYPCEIMNVPAVNGCDYFFENTGKADREGQKSVFNFETELV
jgi:U32 family peptidase